MVASQQAAGERNREDARQRSRAKSEAAQEIGEFAPCQHPAERAIADGNLRYFIERYFAAQVSRAWSDDHLRIIEKLERTITEGEWFAVAMPRGSGKTTLCQIAVVWAVLTGRHQYAYLICGTAQKAVKVLNNIKSMLRFNDLLYDDYPEAIHPIRVLNGETRRCEGQRYRGEKTAIQWGVDKLGLAMIPGAKCSGAIIHVSGITGDIRGQNHVRPDGISVRPSLALVDDPQTDESAKSVIQTQDRMEIVHGTIAGLAGPGQRIAILITCTVIAPNDMAEQILDRVRFPQWRGEKTSAVKSWPEMELWDQYKEIWNEERLAEGDGSKANAFYVSNRVAMDAGFEVAWEARKDERDLSAQQHMMHILFDRGESAFYAEYQNEPKPQYKSVDRLDPKELRQRCLGVARGVVPLRASRITCFIDVQKELLYYVVTAWADDFTGFVIDYGSYPDQGVPYFSHESARKTLSRASPGAGPEGAIRQGLESLTLLLLAREWTRQDGLAMKIERCLVDANYKTDVVYEFCRQSQFSPVVMPRIGFAKKSLRYEPKVGDGGRHGLGWIVQRSERRAIVHALVEVNTWKSFVAARLKTTIGDKGALAFFGKEQDHRMFIDHLCSEEMMVNKNADGAELEEWDIRTEADDQNHLWDCLVGCAAAANIQGVTFAGVTTAPPARKKVSFAEQQRAAFARQGVKAG